MPLDLTSGVDCTRQINRNKLSLVTTSVRSSQSLANLFPLCLLTPYLPWAFCQPAKLFEHRANLLLASEVHGWHPYELQLSDVGRPERRAERVLPCHQQNQPWTVLDMCEKNVIVMHYKAL